MIVFEFKCVPNQILFFNLVNSNFASKTKQFYSMLNWQTYSFFFFFFETRSYYIDHSSLKLTDIRL